MISNLPLLFAEGYPTCLEKFTLAQLEKFVPFMLQCSLGEIHVDKYTPPPKWWPNELPFANTVEKPSGMDESRWFSMLKSMVCKCYTHHECEFMLRFCTELSDCPSTSYMFVESWDGTTSLYNKENGRLMVTFRNENREYDKVVETSPRRSLLPKGSTQNAARRLVPPPAFDIYLCDNCDGEFNSLREVQEHERTCNKQLEDHDQDQDQDQDGAGQYFCSEEPPEQPCQENFLNYFRLYPTNGEIQPERNSPIKQTNCRRRYPAGVTFTRCCSVPFSSPLGVFIQQKSKMAAVKHQVLIDRLERHCVTKLGGLAARYRERDGEFKVQEDIAWPITWKAPHPKKSLDNWTHYYCFTQKERLERLATQLSGGLNLRSRRLLSLCKEVRILLWRMSEEEIKFYTTRRPVPPETNPGECQTFQFPTLLPNTMYTYRTNVNCRTGYAQSIEILENPTMSMSPDPTIPLIDLCSTDEEDEDVKSPVPLSVVPCPEGTDDEDNDGYCYDPTHRRIEEDEQDYSFSDSSTYSYVDVENASFENSAMDYTNAFSSVPQDWQMKVCINSQPSPPASSSASEEDDDGEEEVQEIVSVEPTNFNFVNVDSKVTSFPRNQRKGSVHLGGYNRSQTEHLHVFEHEMEDKIYSPVLHDSPINNAKSHRVQDKHNMQENMQLSMSSCESATVSRNDTRRRSSAVSGVPLSKGKNLLQNRDINSVSITSSKSADICDVMEIIEIPKSNRSKLPTLCQRREQAAKLLGTTCIQNKNDSSLTPLFVNVDNVGLHDDALNHSVTDPAGLGGRVRLSRKLMNTVSPVPTMPKLTRGPSNAISSSRSTLSRERSGILTPLPLPPPLKPAFVQSGSGIPFNFNSFHDLNSHRQNEIQVLRRGCKRQLPNDEPSDEEVEIIVDDNDDDNEPVRKKPCVEEYGAMVSTVDASTQDTSNNDVFGMSVKHEKATESHERCLATSKFPMSVLRLRQDECRKLKRRGLCYVSCKGGRQSKENDCCLDHFGNVTIKKEPGIGGSVPRLGKRVIVTLLDNEVELICSNSAETGLCSIEKKELITSSDCKYEMELKFSRLNNINCSGPKKKECTDQKVTIAAPSTHTCPLVKAEDCHSMEQKFSSDSWKYSDYSSPMMMMSSMMLSVNPEQTLKHSEKSNSEIGPMKVEAKCLREDAKRFKHLDIDFSIKSNLKLDKNGFRVGKKKNNVISSNNLFRSNGQHCFRRKAIDSEEKYSRNLSSSKECKSRCKGDKEIESHKHIKRQNRSKCSSRNSENCTETYRRSLRRCHLNMKNHICKIQCKKH